LYDTLNPRRILLSQEDGESLFAPTIKINRNIKPAISRFFTFEKKIAVHNYMNRPDNFLLHEQEEQTRITSGVEEI